MELESLCWAEPGFPVEYSFQDALILVRSELPRPAVRQLNERSLAWPKDLRRRWTYAMAAAAVGGLVF